MGLNDAAHLTSQALKKSPLIQGALLKLGAAELGSEAEGGLHQTTELIEAFSLGCSTQRAT